MRPKVLVLLEDGFEDHEFSGPLLALRKAGIQADIASHQKNTSLTGKHGSKAKSDLTYNQVVVNNYAGLLIPGGRSPEKVRKFPKAIEITREFAKTNKPIAAICHGPQVLATAGLLKGKTATCWPKIANQIRGAGATYVDEEVVKDGYLITSRNPSDVPAFAEQLIKSLF